MPALNFKQKLSLKITTVLTILACTFYVCPAIAYEGKHISIDLPMKLNQFYIASTNNRLLTRSKSLIGNWSIIASIEVTPQNEVCMKLCTVVDIPVAGDITSNKQLELECTGFNAHVTLNEICINAYSYIPYKLLSLLKTTKHQDRLEIVYDDRVIDVVKSSSAGAWTSILIYPKGELNEGVVSDPLK